MSSIVYKENIVVRWGDIDALRHVNNSLYFSYFEQARANWLYANDIFDLPDAAKPVLVAVSAAFRRAIEFPATLSVEIYLGKVGTRSLQTLYKIVDAQDETVVYATGDATQVWVDAAAKSAIGLPQQVRDYLAQVKG